MRLLGSIGRAAQVVQRIAKTASPVPLIVKAERCHTGPAPLENIRVELLKGVNSGKVSQGPLSATQTPGHGGIHSSLRSLSER